MCGRFALGIPRKAVRERFGLTALPDAPPRFNIAPGQLVEAVTMDALGPRAGLYRWGLVPSWAKDASLGAKLINARAETAWDKPAFRAAIRRRRCLVPAQGFYEWSGEPGRRQAWFFAPRGGGVMAMREGAKCARPMDPVAPGEGGVMALAGIWEHYESPGGEVIESLAVLTCEANGLVAPIHHRMPVVVIPEDDARWLDPSTFDRRDLADILAPREWPGFHAWKVGPRVNSARNEGPDLIEPWPPLT